MLSDQLIVFSTVVVSSFVYLFIYLQVCFNERILDCEV